MKNLDTEIQTNIAENFPSTGTATALNMVNTNSKSKGSRMIFSLPNTSPKKPKTHSPVIVPKIVTLKLTRKS